MGNGNYNPHDEDFEQYDEGYTQEDLDRDMTMGAGDEALLADLPAPKVFLGVKPVEKGDLGKPDFSEPTIEEKTEEVDLYERTTKATEDAYKSWRKMMKENYEKRKAENKRQVRNAQIVGLGKALGDLVAGIWGGVSSLKNDAPAIVPARQSSRTAEQIQKLINEGVVDSRDYDTMLQNLAMQEDKDKIAIAKSYDELEIRNRQLAEKRKYDQQKEEDDRAYEAWKAEQQHENRVDILRQRGLNALAVANARSNKGGKQQNFSESDLLILGAAIPDVETVTTEKTGPDKYGQEVTTTTSRQVKPDKSNNALALELARQKDEMKRLGLDPNKDADKRKWAMIIADKRDLAAALPNVAEAKIFAALLKGYTREEILAHFRKK